MILSSGVGINGREILKIAKKQNKLNYKKYFNKNKNFYRKEDAILIGNRNNTKILKKKFGFKFSIYGSKLVKKIYREI